MLPNLGPLELMIVGGLAVLLFGKRLPEVGRSLGKGILEFKKGLNEVASGLDDDSSGISGYSSSSAHSAASRYDRPAIESTPAEADVPKFEVPGAVSTAAGD